MRNARMNLSVMVQLGFICQWGMKVNENEPCFLPETFV
jgi:hypothetical protein